MNSFKHQSLSRFSALGRVCLLLAAALMALVQTACVSTSVKRVDATPAEHADSEIAASQLLNVNITMLDENVPEDVETQEEERIYPEVRKAEARYFPVNLRRTLEQTGQWGAVRVVPDSIPWSELLVTGKIIESDGYRLALDIRAVDASGRVWLDEHYEQEAAKLSYSPEVLDRADPFQATYNRIANDLLEARRKLEKAELVEIRRLSELRFAADLAPDAFARHFSERRGRYRLESLPAEGDPMLARINAIRARDYALIDSLDQHYLLFHDQIDPNYDQWRSASYTETEAYEQLRRQSLGRKIAGAAAVVAGVAGVIASSGSSAPQSSGGARRQTAGTAGSIGAVAAGVYLLKSGIDKGRESELHKASLEELGQSLQNDVKPNVVELENQTVTLSGSAEQQYETWRKLLRNIYAEETGLVTGDADAQNRSGESH